MYIHVQMIINTITFAIFQRIVEFCLSANTSMKRERKRLMLLTIIVSIRLYSAIFSYNVKRHYGKPKWTKMEYLVLLDLVLLLNQIPFSNIRNAISNISILIINIDK